MQITIEVNDNLQSILDNIVNENSTEDNIITAEIYLGNLVNSELTMIYKNRLIQPILNSDVDSLQEFDETINNCKKNIQLDKI